MRKIILVIVLALIITSLFAEEISKKKYPLTAGALSCLLPGGGQFYNGKLIKSGVVFALEGSLIGLAVYHHLEAEKNYDKYKIDPNLNTYFYQEYVKYYERRQSDFFWIGTVVFLSAIDAYIDAHLFDFDDKKKKIHLKFENNTVGLVYNF